MSAPAAAPNCLPVRRRGGRGSTAPACRKAAYEDRRAGRDGAVKVQLVDRVIVQTVERVEHRPHPPRECVTTDRPLLRGGVVLPRHALHPS